MSISMSTLKAARFSSASSGTVDTLRSGSLHGASSETTDGESVCRLLPGLKNQVVVLAGATSVGKSKVATFFSRHMGNCEIIIADSVQIYKHLDIGSNKPTAEEQSEIPHHLVDIREPHESYSCGEFVRNCKPIIYDILNRDKIPVIVGGSTLWLQWLVQGIPDAPKAEEHIVMQADNMITPLESSNNWDAMLLLLQQYDAERAAIIHKNDWYRARRYLEVALSVHELRSTEGSSIIASTTASSGVKEGGDEKETASRKRKSVVSGNRIDQFPDLDLRCFFLSEDRELLYHNIDSRCEAMLHNGLIEEVGSLLQKGHFNPEGKVWRAIGYRQSIAFLLSVVSDGEENISKNFKHFLRDFATATRNYAKRQLHWYRKDNTFLWLEIDRPDPNQGSADVAPYEKIAREIEHWNSIPTSNYRSMIKQQMLRAKGVAAIRGKKKEASSARGHRMKIKGEYEWLALASLVASGEIQPPQVTKDMTNEDIAASWTTHINAETSVETSSQMRFDAPIIHSEEDMDESLLLKAQQEIDVDDDDAIMAQMSQRGRDTTVPRTMPSFPTSLLPSMYSAEQIPIRAGEAEGNKGSRKMKGYQTRVDYSGTEIGKFDTVLTSALEVAQVLQENHSSLLEQFRETMYGGKDD